MSAEDELAAVEAKLESVGWTIDLLYGVTQSLVAERDALKKRLEQERRRDLRRAKQHYGEGTVER